MPNDDPQPSNNDTRDDRHTVMRPQLRNAPTHSIFSVPRPLKRVFDQFPLVTYAPNELPVRAPKDAEKALLYVFTTPGDSKLGRPSFNPACLKWQTYLKICDVDFRTAPSSNHASPTGVLPFLLPSRGSKDTGTSQLPIAGNKLRRWVASKSTSTTSEDLNYVRSEPYGSLVDHRIRKAWLYQLYLDPANALLVQRLYVEPCSSQPLVQMNAAYRLRCAAEQELVKASASNIISETTIMGEAQEAFTALSMLLGSDQWFFGRANPNLFDASVFAFTHLILDDTLGWRRNELAKHLHQHENLIQHRQRIANEHYGH